MRRAAAPAMSGAVPRHMAAALLAWSACVLASPEAEAEGRRFAVAVGENVGEPGDEELRFAESDARAVLEVLRTLGGVRPEDSVAVLGTTAAGLGAQLAVFEQTLLRVGAGPADTLFVYVSSHAGEGSLHLRGTQFALAELRAFLERSPVGVGVLIVDTCQAGYLIRTKGLEPVTTRSVVVERPKLHGRVYIVSSGPTESAHESDPVGGSYFTHHLLAGLRGAADGSRDGRVTLQEAFGYAYARTVETTVGARGGRQTPRYELQLTGEQDIVLTEQRRARGRLAIDVERPGDWVVTPLDEGWGATRFVKASGPVVFAVTPGAYRLRTSDGERTLQHDVRVGEGRTVSIRDEDLRAWEVLVARAKGRGPRVALNAAAHAGTAAVGGVWPVLPGVAVGAAVTDRHALVGDRTAYELSAALRWGQAEHPSTFLQQELDLVLGVGPEWALGAVDLRALVLLGGVLVWQDMPGESRHAFLPRLGAQLALQVPLGGPAHLDARLGGGGQYVTTDEEGGLRPFGTASVGVGIDL